MECTGNKDDAKARIEAQAEIQKAIKESELYSRYQKDALEAN